LLEKYKNYDPNFQVGSAVVDFRDLIENDINNPRKIAECPVSFMTRPEPKDDTHGLIFDEITKKHELNRYDFSYSPITFTNNNLISKRTHNTAHNHPDLVGTLDKCKFVLNVDAINAEAFNDPNVKILERDFFQKHIEQGIINPYDDIEVVVELKYDGISVEADCDNHVVSARTRGDTNLGEAADISPILQGYTFRQAKSMIGEKPIGVKFEAIMTKANLEMFNRVRGKNYANCRTAIVGLFGASDAILFRDYITLIPLALDRSDIPSITNRMEEINLLNTLFRSNGEPLRYCYFKGNLTEVLYLVKAFYDEAKLARDYLDFMFDGIVVSYVDESIRQRLGRENYINKFSMAVKFDPMLKQTIFRGYTYEVGQDGRVTPMIHYDPVEFIGTIHTKSTGSSYNRFQNLQLKYGDIIEVEYRNDVMPYVSKLDCDANRNNPNPVIEFIKECPICGAPLVITDTGNMAICPNNECPDRSLQRVTNMFAKLNIKGFADACFSALDKYHLYELAEISPNEAVDKLGKADGANFINEIYKLKTQPQKDYIVMAALGFTGIAYKKWMSVLDKIRLIDIHTMYKESNGDPFTFKDRLLPILGNSVLLNTIVSEWSFFEKDIDYILSNFHIVDSFGMSSEEKIQIRMTGFRNSHLVEQLTNLGIDADDSSSVTKKTNILLVPYESFTSNKVTTAKKYGIQILQLNDFLVNSEKYIGIKLI
jgi:NAD-dependent DNA ligase